MKVLNLRCSNGHGFEGWFASDDEFMEQNGGGELQALWMKAVRHVLSHTEDVGERFAEEARRIHYGEVPERGIRGQVDAQQRDELIEEGIEVFALPLPRALDGPLQ